MRRSFILITLTLFLFACQDGTRTVQPAPSRDALKASPLYQYFTTIHPGKSVLVWAFQDVNHDGRKDLIVIYAVKTEKNAMLVILDLGKTYTATNDVPAPVENQQITFKDIDGKPPMEIIVRGMKGINVGYAIYRIEDGRLVDLFGEGMDGCC